MDKIIEDFNIGLLIWQILCFIMLGAIVYILFKVFKKVSKW